MTVLGLAAGICLRMGIYPPQIYDKLWRKIRINNGILVAPFSDKPRADFENLTGSKVQAPLVERLRDLTFSLPKGNTETDRSRSRGSALFRSGGPILPLPC